MNIAHRCLQCGSNDIDVKVMYNLISQKVTAHLNGMDDECWCNNCRKWTTFGWIELDEVLQRKAQRELEDE